MAHVVIMNLQRQQIAQAEAERRRRICAEEEEIVLKENDIAAKQMIDAKKNEGSVKKTYFGLYSIKHMQYADGYTGNQIKVVDSVDLLEKLVEEYITKYMHFEYFRPKYQIFMITVDPKIVTVNLMVQNKYPILFCNNNGLYVSEEIWSIMTDKCRSQIQKLADIMNLTTKELELKSGIKIIYSSCFCGEEEIREMRRRAILKLMGYSI